MVYQLVELGSQSLFCSPELQINYWLTIPVTHTVDEVSFMEELRAGRAICWLTRLLPFVVCCVTKAVGKSVGSRTLPRPSSAMEPMMRWDGGDLIRRLFKARMPHATQQNTIVGSRILSASRPKGNCMFTHLSVLVRPLSYALIMHAGSGGGPAAAFVE